jgi:hypothetical protein
VTALVNSIGDISHIARAIEAVAFNVLSWLGLLPETWL